MNVLLIDPHAALRLSVFLTFFAAMAIWETAAPRRTLRTPKSARWLTNFSLTFLNSLLGRALPVTMLAVLAESKRWGLFYYLSLPSFAAGPISIVLLDLSIYLQHLIFHRIRFFWNIHRMHHTDLDLDVTTGTRFHPVEIVLSLLIKMGIVLLLGTPVWSFVVFELLLNATSMFNHSNILISTPMDRLVRRILVTPDMHRVHHSVIRAEHNSNFGFNLSWWDRLFRTYRAEPHNGHEKMVLGLANFRNPQSLSLPALLLLPFHLWNES